MQNTSMFSKMQTIAMCIIAILALVVIADYILPKDAVTKTITGSKRKLENKQSVARNYYYAYYITTEDLVIPVSKELLSEAEKGKTVTVEITPFFKETQRITFHNGRTEIYTLRIASGLLLPLIAIICMILGLKYRARVNPLVFGTQVFFLINFIYILY